MDTRNQTAICSTESIAHEAAQDGVLSISVIVPVRNEQRYIESILHELANQDYPRDRYEILVIDGQSTDQTCQLVQSLQQQYPHIRLYPNPQRWSSAARNLGLRHARGDVVVIVDGHCCLPGSDYLQNLAAAFRRTNADALGRPQPQDVSQANALQQAIAAARASRLGHHPASYIYSHQEQPVPAKSVAVAYRRETLQSLGGFDDRFDACEDVELNHRFDRSGKTCWLVPETRVHYHPRGTLAGLARQLWRYGRGRVRLMRKHPETRSLAVALPAVLLAMFAIGAALVLASLTWPNICYFISLVYLALLAVYTGTVISFSLAIAAAKRNLKLLCWLPAVFAAIHFGAAWGVWQELLFGRRDMRSPATSRQTAHRATRVEGHSPSEAIGGEPAC